MTKLKSILSEIYIDGFASSNIKSRFIRPKNFYYYGQCNGWTIYTGGNDWENSITACAVYFEGDEEGESARVWFYIKFPKELEKYVNSKNSSNNSELISVKKWGDKAAKTWVKIAKKIHKESKHKVNPNNPDCSWSYKSWKSCFIESLKSKEMQIFVKEWGVDSTHWNKMSPIFTNESMFPKKFNRHSLGVCMDAAEYATIYLLNKGVSNFKIVEGWVSLYDGQERKDWSPHTWIEFSNGRKFDPTKKQWSQWGFDPNEVTYKKVKTQYSPEEYINLCKLQSNIPKDQIVESPWLRNWKSWWMSPSGDLIEVYMDEQKRYGHHEWAKDFLNSRGIKYDNPTSYLQSRRWIRLAFNYEQDNILHFDYDRKIPPSESIMSKIKKLAFDLEASGLHDDITNKPIELLESLNEIMTYNDLLKLADKGRRARAKDVRTRSIPVTVEDGKESWNFRYKSNPSVTDKPFQGSIKFFKEINQTGMENASDLPCQVDCSCPDFMYRWAWNDAAKNASTIGLKSLNKCIDRKPKPGYDFGEGICKHLIALERYLRTKIKSSSKKSLFEIMDEIVKNNPTFNIEY